MGKTRENKAAYFEKLKELLNRYPSIFLVNVDNVSSQQMHQIRHALRGRAQVLMGKNTMVRRALRGIISEMPHLEKLLPYIRGNIGFVFTGADLKEIRDVVLENKVAAPARAGAVAPVDVDIQPGPTGMDPAKTGFFQALSIPTKIVRGSIEIVSTVHLVHKGTKVGASEATLLNILNISPFTYGMSIAQIFDQGNMFGPEVLDIGEAELVGRFMSGVNQIAAISLALQYPTIASIMHSFVNGYKNVLAVSVASDYTFTQSEKIKEMLENPEAFAAVAAPAAAAGAPAAEDKPAAKEEEAEESDDDMGFGLFD